MGYWRSPGCRELGFSSRYVTKIPDLAEAWSRTCTWKGRAGPALDLHGRHPSSPSASVSLTRKPQEERSSLLQLYPGDLPRRKENVLRMLRKPPGRGKQVAPVRPLTGAASEDRCPRARRPLSPRRLQEHAGSGPPQLLPRRSLPGRAVPSRAATLPAPPPHARCRVSSPRRGRAPSLALERGFLSAMVNSSSLSCSVFLTCFYVLFILCFLSPSFLWSLHLSFCLSSLCLPLLASSPLAFLE